MPSDNTVVLDLVADLGFFRGGDFGNPTRAGGVSAYGRILYICELGIIG